MDERKIKREVNKTMIIQETFYAVECDVCKEQAENFDGISFWGDISRSEEQASDNGWHTEGDKHYCHKCHSIDEDDKLIVKDNQPH